MPVPQEVMDRLFNNVWVCMRCNAKMRSSKKPDKCRKCGSKRIRPKRKPRKGK